MNLELRIGVVLATLKDEQGGPKMNVIISPISDPTKVVFSSLSTEQIKLGSEFDVDALNPPPKPPELNA